MRSRNVTKSIVALAVLVLVATSLNVCVADENNYQRALGIAHSAPGVAECLSQARADGHGVNPEARGTADENGELTNWTVVYFSDRLDLGGNRIIIAVVYIENWEIVASECRL